MDNGSHRDDIHVCLHSCVSTQQSGKHRGRGMGGEWHLSEGGGDFDGTLGRRWASSWAPWHPQASPQSGRGESLLSSGSAGSAAHCRLVSASAPRPPHYCFSKHLDSSPHCTLSIGRALTGLAFAWASSKNAGTMVLIGLWPLEGTQRRLGM